MLKEIFLQKLNTQSKTVHNAIITLGDTDNSGKGKKFKSRFIQPGVAGYPGQFGNVLITKETLDKFIKTMVGVPVIINHKDITVDNADDERVGVVSNVWYDDKDGWYWCDGVIWNETAQNLITDKNWSVSCSYDVKFADDAGGTENNIKYDMEFLDGVFTHLAIVDNPRYERANIVFNSKTEIVNGILDRNGCLHSEIDGKYIKKYKTDMFEILKEQGYGNDIFFKNKKENIPDFDKHLIEEYKKIVDKTFSNSLSEQEKSSLINIGYTPIKLQEAGVKNYKLKISIDTIAKARNQKNEGHNLDIDTIKSIPEYLHNPIVVMKSISENHEEDSVVIITEAKDNTETPVIVAIRLDVDENKDTNKKSYLINEIKSIHGRSNLDFVFSETIKHKGLLKADPNKMQCLHKFTHRLQDDVAENTANNSITHLQENFNPIHEEILTANNNKENEMALLDELKKLISKVENDKGEEMEKVENEKVDKRKLIDEVGGILKGKVDEEVWRTVIGKIEKIGYNESEKGTADNEKECDEDNKKVENETKEDKEKVEELKEEVKKDVENKCKNSVENSKVDFFGKMNEVYNAAMKATQEQVDYVSRQEKLDAAVDYFSK